MNDAASAGVAAAYRASSPRADHSAAQGRFVGNVTCIPVAPRAVAAPLVAAAGRRIWGPLHGELVWHPDDTTATADLQQMMRVALRLSAPSARSP